MMGSEFLFAIRKDLPTMVAAALVTISDAAYCETAVSRVSLTVAIGQVKQSTAGTLYKVVADERSYVADVNPDGKVNRPVVCAEGDTFEAEAESSLNRPVAPTRRTCGSAMAFSFRRTLLVSWPANTISPLLVPETGPAIYSNYATIFAKTEHQDAASAWSDAAIAATAKEALGDTKLDKFVARDPAQDYRLVLTAKGVAALKLRQLSLGLTQSGQIDGATQAAIAMIAGKNPHLMQNAVAPLACVVKEGAASNPIICGAAATLGMTGLGNPKNFSVTNLPSVRFKSEF